MSLCLLQTPLKILFLLSFFVLVFSFSLGDGKDSGFPGGTAIFGHMSGLSTIVAGDRSSLRFLGAVSAGVSELSTLEAFRLSIRAPLVLLPSNFHGLSTPSIGDSHIGDDIMSFVGVSHFETLSY